MSHWKKVCNVNDIDEEDAVSFEHDGRIYAVFNTEKGFFATDGICTHEHQALADGLVFGTVIECPLHQGQFDITSGEALCPPVCKDLKTYSVKVESSQIYIKLL